MNPFDFSMWLLWLIGVVFIFAPAVSVVASVNLTHRADKLADATGLGEALFGAVLSGRFYFAAGNHHLDLDGP